MKERLARIPGVGLALAVQERFGDVNGNWVARSITLTAFLSIFPIILVAVAVLGFISDGDPQFADDVIDELGLTGETANTVRDSIQAAEDSKEASSVVGLIGLLWSGLGLAAVAQYAYDVVWQVATKGVIAKVKGIVWALGAVVLFASSFAVTAVLNFLPAVFAPLGIASGLALSIGLWLWTGRVLSPFGVGIRDLLPGAVLGGVGLEALKLLGGVYLPNAVSSSSALYGSIGVVFALLAWLFFFGRLIMYSAVLNVVLYERRHGSVTVETRAPRYPGKVALAADRTGQITEVAS